MFLETLLLIPFTLLLLPVLVYVLEIVAACLQPQRNATLECQGKRARLAVLIPAHNEEAGIARTLNSVTPQLSPGDILLVVADNCSDQTAHIVQQSGATVLSREHKTERGKGYALAYGLDYLQENPPEVVIFIDADCQLGSHTLTALAQAAVKHESPAQALYLCLPPNGSSLQHALSALAFRFKNYIRMRGMTALGGACHLTGSGMAIPWELTQKVTWATGNIVEDMQLGIDFSCAGMTPRFVPDAFIQSELPVSPIGMLQQRKRWEHGFLMTALQQVPLLLGTAWEKKSWSVFILALDMLVPPLALLTLLLAGSWLFALALALLGFAMQPLILMSGIISLFVATTLLAWYRFCRDAVPFRTLLGIPGYLFSKLPVYCDLIFQRQQQWNRAQRSSIG